MDYAPDVVAIRVAVNACPSKFTSTPEVFNVTADGDAGACRD